MITRAQDNNLHVFMEMMCCLIEHAHISIHYKTGDQIARIGIGPMPTKSSEADIGGEENKQMNK